VVGEIVRVERGLWGLKEWYPGRSFKAKGDNGDDKGEAKGAPEGGADKPSDQPPSGVAKKPEGMNKLAAMKARAAAIAN
jgi:hypothetical protein